MDARLVQIKLDQRLNKLASEDYDNIECWQKREAVQKAQLEWTRRQIHGINQTKEGDEETSMKVDDIQFLLKPKELLLTNKGLYYESELYPIDFGWSKSILIYADKGECKDQLMTDVNHIEEANVSAWLNDWSKTPSFEFRQCFYTLAGNRVRVYTNGEFNVSKVVLTYYRLPIKFDIEGCENYDGDPGKNVNLEFKDDVAELIIDEAASIIAGDIENTAAYQVTSQRKETNN